MDFDPRTVCNEMVHAIYEKNHCAVQRLLHKGFNVNTELLGHKYPIIICIEADSLKIGELLISEGCSLSLKTVMGNTPLHVAVELANYDFVELLIDNCADVSSVNNNNKTPLHLAAQMNSLRLVKILMKKATPGVLNIRDAEDKTPFIHACCCGNDALISYFISLGCDSNEVYGRFYETPLLSALSNPHLSLSTVNILLSAGANINMFNKESETPLLKAIQRSNMKGNHCYSLFESVSCLLIDKGSNLNQRNTLGYTPLHYAVVINNEFLVRKLLNYGSPINATNDHGFTPLFLACNRERFKIARLLMDNGASLRIILNIVQDDLWLGTNDELRNPDSVLNYVIEKSRECQSLTNLCRVLIRKHLPKDIEKSAVLLPLPDHLIKSIQLVE